MTKTLRNYQKSICVLSSLLDTSQKNLFLWSTDDLAAILDHQLSVPLSESSPTPTFGDAFFGKANSEQALAQVKNFAKEVLARDSDFPDEIARILYVSAILRALGRGYTSITSLSRSEVEREARWCLTLFWLPESFRELIATELRNCGGR